MKLFVANRGEIARRIFRTCRAMGIASVAAYSDPDFREPFVTEADEAVPLRGSTAAESYLRIDSLVEAAVGTGCDAVHPGYGFLAENAEFAEACAAAGLTFVGPAPATIAAMGSKLESKRIMRDAGVPVLEGIDLTGASPKEIALRADELGYPLLVKASAGGGGKGMRVVSDPQDLKAAVESAGREAESSFGDGTLFLEPYLEAPRHVEVQIFGDSHGNIVHLFERECSIQRRHQKIIEETPSPAVNAELREQLGEAAMVAARAVDYLGAGTVEFLLDGEGQFLFLEMNTRLQVEHTVTEEVTGLDLVRLQLLIASGLPLPREALEARQVGHAIEARLYAEDPAHDFLPSTGTVHTFRFPEGVRVDSGVEDGSEVTVHYDPLIAKVIAHAPAREEAARVLAAALVRAHIHGVATNRELLVRTLRDPEFISGDTDTAFLERRDLTQMGRPLPDPEGVQRAAVAAAIVGQARRRSTAPVLAAAPSGWRNNPSQLQSVSFEGPEGTITVGYSFGPTGLSIEVDGDDLGSCRAENITEDSLRLVSGGVARTHTASRVGDDWFVDGPEGPVHLTQRPRFPQAEQQEPSGSLYSPMPGRIIQVRVAAGEDVISGQALVVVEAMKMEHTVRSPTDGRVQEVLIAEGEQVDADQALVVVEGD